MKYREFCIIDENGFITSVFFQKIMDDEGNPIPEDQQEKPPENAVEAPVEKFYQARFNHETKQWEEGLTPEEIERIKEINKNPSEPIDETENLRRQVLSLQRMCNILLKNQADKENVSTP